VEVQLKSSQSSTSAKKKERESGLETKGGQTEQSGNLSVHVQFVEKNNKKKRGEKPRDSKGAQDSASGKG